MNFNIYNLRSLKTRVTLFTLTIFLFSIWALSFYARQTLHKEIENLLSTQQFSTASFIAAGINDELKNRKESLEKVASVLGPVFEQGNKVAIQEFLEQRPAFQSMFNIGTFVTRLDGIAIADAPISAGRIGLNYLDRDFMPAVLNEGKTMISSPVIGKRLGTPIFAMATPIRDAQGKVIGALVAGTDLSKPNFLDKISQNHYGKTGGYVLVAPQPRLFITGTDQRFVMQSTPAPGVNPLLDRYILGFEGSGVITDSRGVESLSSAKRIPAADWLLIVRIPTAEAFAPIQAIQHRIFQITLIMTVLAGGLAWWMLSRQLAPMHAAVRLLAAQSDTSLPSRPLPITRHDEVGELIGGFNHLLEILSEREKMLQENQKKLADIVQFLPDATLAIDKEKRVIIWNKAIEKMTGILASEMIGKGDHAYTIPFYGIRRSQLMDLIFQDQEEIASLYPQIVREGSTLVAEFFCNALYDNKGAWVFAKASPLFDQAGNIIGAIEAIRDITERKMAEEALRESEVKFRTVADHIHDWEYWMAADGGLVYVSPSCERITSYKSEEFYQDPGLLTRIVHPEDRESFIQHVDEVVKNRSTEDFHTRNFRIQTRNGDDRWIEHVCREVFDQEGRSIGRRVSNQDITERWKAEEEKLKLEGQFQQAQKMEAIGQLAGGVAHDFNNMLAVIQGYAEMTLEQVDPTGPLFNDLEQIQKAAHRSAGVVRKLLAFARRQLVAPEVLNLNETVEGMIKMLERLLGEDINLAWLPGENLWPVKIDPSQIDQILANLCINARDAIAGVGKMTIETGNRILNNEYSPTHEGVIPGEYVWISVSDNGIGIDKETLSHIFEPFFTTKGIGKGTGLGLSMVYGSIKQNGGFVNVYSEPGQGTTFTLYLPRHIGEIELVQKEGAAVPAANCDETILLVEDELTTLNMVTTMLQRMGYTVLAANTPGQAIQMASDFRSEINLVVTDVIMPDMNGRDLAERLRAIQPDLKCLYMSGYTANVIAHHGVLEEGVHFIQKPFSKNELASKVRQALV